MIDAAGSLRPPGQHSVCGLTLTAGLGRAAMQPTSGGRPPRAGLAHSARVVCWPTHARRCAHVVGQTAATVAIPVGLLAAAAARPAAAASRPPATLTLQLVVDRSALARYVRTLDREDQLSSEPVSTFALVEPLDAATARAASQVLSTRPGSRERRDALSAALSATGMFAEGAAEGLAHSVEGGMRTEVSATAVRFHGTLGSSVPWDVYPGPAPSC